MAKINVKGPIIGNDDAWIYDWFGWDYTSPQTIRKGLDDAAGEDVEIEINSPGGYVSYGYEMYAALMSYTGKVTAHVITACSAATLLICAANKVLISDAGYIMIHNASTQQSGNKTNMQQAHDRLQAIDDGIINAYIRKTGKTKEELQEMMDRETYMAPAQAIEMGFADGYLFGKPEEKEKNSTAQQFVAAAVQMIPEEKAKELAVAIKAIEKGDFAPVQKEQTTAQAESEIENKEGKEKMTLQEVVAQNPEIKAEIDAMKDECRKAGMEEERNRIQSLDAIAKTVTPEALNEAKYGEHKVDGKTLAYDAMVNGEKLAQAYLTDAQADTEDSKAGEVKSGKPEEEEKNEADEMASYINARKGV